jgi:hypothetical protein
MIHFFPGHSRDLDDRFHKTGLSDAGSLLVDFLVCFWLNEDWCDGRMAACGQIGDER